MKKKSEVLVVDDDFAHRTMLKTLISGWGYGVSEAMTVSPPLKPSIGVPLT
jgi:CheY-like chemotaxis protein